MPPQGGERAPDIIIDPAEEPQALDAALVENTPTTSLGEAYSANAASPAGIPPQLEGNLIRLNDVYCGVDTLDDPDVFAEVFMACVPLMRRVLSRFDLARVYCDPEDIIATAYLKAWTSRLQYQNQGKGPANWLVAIARNAAVDEMRRPQHTIPQSLDELQEEHPDQEVKLQSLWLERRDEDDLLAGIVARGGVAAIGRFLQAESAANEGDSHRTVDYLQLYEMYREGLSLDKYAARHSLTKQAVKSQRTRFRNSLRRQFGQDTIAAWCGNSQAVY